MHIVGIGFALLALLCWGFGDFFIQRTSRDFGVIPSLFCITASAAIVLFPFIAHKLPYVFTAQFLPILLTVSVTTLVVALIEFNALKLGKIAIVEPILSFELPLTVLLSVLILAEPINGLQAILIALVFIGILLVGYTGKIQARHFLEKGALLAIVSAFVMAVVNFTTGLSSQEAGPVVTIWFMSTFISIFCIMYFIATKSWHTLVGHVKKHPIESALVALFDNGAWLSYAAAAVFIPISLAITVSEGYIILAILLGVIINHEKLVRHQWAGVVISLVSVIILAAIS